jgi:hypothetical protein
MLLRLLIPGEACPPRDERPYETILLRDDKPTTRLALLREFANSRTDDKPYETILLRDDKPTTRLALLREFANSRTDDKP